MDQAGKVKLYTALKSLPMAGLRGSDFFRRLGVPADPRFAG